MGALLRRYRAWRSCRRIERALNEAGFDPAIHSVFNGNVDVQERVYEYADFYLWNYSEKRTDG